MYPCSEFEVILIRFHRSCFSELNTEKKTYKNAKHN